MAANEGGEAGGASRGGGQAAVVVGEFGLLGVEGGAGAAHDDEGARAGQARLKGFDGVDAYLAGVDASVGGVGFFLERKRGAVAAAFSAALKLWRASCLS